jgi:hypothetical protein
VRVVDIEPGGAAVGRLLDVGVDRRAAGAGKADEPETPASPLPSVTDVKAVAAVAVVICVEPIVVRSATSLML